MVNEETNRNNIFLMDQTANPAPLGLCAFGTTTILLSLWNAGVIGITSPIFAMAIFYGGLAQIIAGLMEWKKNNNFGFLTFVSFGFFWMTFAGVLMLPVLGLAKAPGPADLAAFLAVWGIVALGLLICTLNMHRSLQVTVLAVFLLIVILVAAELTGSGLIKLAGGVMGVIAGGLALYIGIGQVINEVHNRKIFPV
ncbi:acetate uptake transporter [Methanoregula sp.]|uniref:acetate uptake transporter n=1 Tax=Methanoregula sp. TaxID=2052170 RepID=UPI003FD82915